eukprot:COSAG02_NODE_23350_length_721_cov_1.327974_1_plen_29_part_10
MVSQLAHNNYKAYTDLLLPLIPLPTKASH